MNSKIQSTATIGDIVTQFPQTSSVFKDYRIDFCCNGNRPLIDAIQEKQLNEAEVLAKLNDILADIEHKHGEVVNWEHAAYSELIDHIVNDHHAYLHTNLPEISAYVTKILRVHGANHDELAQVHKLFHSLKMEMELHMVKEEQDLFPLIKDYDQQPATAKLEKIVSKIDGFEEEHDVAGDLVKKLREVTSDFALPEDACRTYAFTYQKLEEMESDLFQHIHLENNILFPRLMKA